MYPGTADVDVLPALPVHALSPIHSTTPLPYADVDQHNETSDLPRSASYSHLSGLSVEAAGQPIKRTFSENVLSLQPQRTSRVTDTMQNANRELFRRASRKTKKKLSGAKFSLSAEEDDADRDERKSNGDGGEHSRRLSRSVTGTIRHIARKSWISTSRPSSPSRKDEHMVEKKRNWSPNKKAPDVLTTSIALPDPIAALPRATSPRHDAEDEESGIPEPIPTPLQRPDMPRNHSLRPLSLFLRSKSETSLKRLSRASSTTSLRSQASTSRSNSRAPSVKVPPLPTSVSTDRLSGFNVETYKRKDPLWTVFRGIEGEYATFQSKTSLHKAKVLRMSLLPFLSKYAQHPSNKALRAEDLDRRVVILNKWWTGLLEMLSGRNNQSISGTDRPAFLEAATAIMMRPEWRVPGFASTPAQGTPRRPSISKSKSTNSLESDEADFLVDSIYQNVRNTFVQNLLSQMAFVVEKLSMRSAPASLVAFSGKACAYAFFFCPGVADMLVRLWRLPPGTVRRIFTEAGLERGDKLDLISKGFISSFPPPARSLMVSSQASLSRHMQPKGTVPPGTEHVHWHGPWTGRWSGRDSDLFFVFTKFFHLLVSDFLEVELSPKERPCVPGLVAVHAQLLMVLETTIYRQAGQHGIESNTSASTSNMENPDASAPLPMTVANASRSIAENRLIMLLRDIVADANPNHVNLRELFISSFDNVIKAATRRISLYNNDACFVLCDFMEEVLPIMSRYHQTRIDAPILDWPFWFEVCRQMMQSQTTLTQIRLIAFVYSTWSILISNEERKRELVLGWLLEPAFFYQHFCHWSPMVRHYFYRLLCWRIARYDGEPTDLDCEIIETLGNRLNRCWAHYQYLSAEADMRNMSPPSSAPCSPAPSRCLIIIRTDSQPPPPVFSALDKLLSPGAMNQTTPYRTHSSLLNSIPAADPAAQPATNKKRWSLLKSINPFNTTPGNHRPGEVTPPGSPDDVTLSSTSHMASITDPLSRPVTPPHQAFSFKFSLEWVEVRPSLANKNRRLIAPLLPTNAQRILEQRRLTQEPPGSSDGGSAGSGSASGSKSSSSTSNSMRGAEVRPLKPTAAEFSSSRYSGRALAEWAQVLMECRNFYSRRKQEGVPKDSLIETPVMGVETFRLVA